MAMNPEDVVMRMSLTHASTLGVAARAIADTAGSLGLPPVDRTQLEALLSEALTAVIADSFDGQDDIAVDVTVASTPGQVEIVLEQHGAPSTYVSGPLPERLETLLSLGYADAMHFVSEGLNGSTLHIAASMPTNVLIEDAAFVADAEAEPVDVVDADELVIRPITADDVVGVARLYFRVHGYTKIQSPWLYEPEVFRHKIADGTHEGVIALTPSGQVVGHAGLARMSPNSRTGYGGPLAVDPAYRSMGLAGRMAQAFFPRVVELQFRGMFAEVITAHPASQKTTLKMGGKEIGVILGGQNPAVEYLGFDTNSGYRRAMMMFFTTFGNSEQCNSYVPARYGPIAERIYSVGNVPRDVVSKAGRLPEDLPEQSTFATVLRSDTKVARITVVEYGKDFVDELQGLLSRFERELFEVIIVFLPLSSPLTAHFGAGLDELGLSFFAVYPENENGDDLVLGVSFTDQDPDTISTASEFGEELLEYVLADQARVRQSRSARARSRASMARILDSL